MTIISNYRLLEKIAETPQAQIFKTYNKNDPDRLLTLKILKTDGLSGSKKAGFRQRIEHLRVLDDPRVITPLVFSDRDGICFIAQDYFDGVTLQEFVDGTPGLPLEAFLAIAIGVASALEKVHEAGIVHGGIKPHNILVDPDTLEIRLIDFVSSVDVRDVSHFIYDRSFIRDTLSYTSPEQTGRISHRVGFPSDLYSLGVVFYEMLTGRLPFASDDPLELIHSHLAEEAPAARDANPDVPLPLDGIVARLLLKEPEKRYQSCTGLLADLVRCRDEYEATGTIAEFPLERDLGASRMTFVSRMVGRDEEARVILDEYEQVAEGAFRSLLISGLSGIGKTRLIQELQKPIVKHRGYFASGKFDVYQRNIPYSSLLQAIRTLVRTFLTESDARVALWKLRISEAIGKNGRVLTDVIPELEVLIGPQPEVGSLPPVESLNRFHDVFDLFLGSLASRENPLTLFIDDLQWCDSASFDFLANIFANYGDHPHLFLLGAYRHNEVDPSHPLSRLIRQARENGQPLKEIRLGPLRPEHCHEMVSYILDAPLDETCSLSEFISTLTEGNPLFVSESLSYLYNEDLLHLDSERQWRWDLQRIGRSRMPTSIVALFGSKIRKLPPDLVDLLEYCACMGNTFSPGELAAIRGMALLAVFETLKPALNQGLLVESKNQLQFIHDKVQEATLAAIPAERRRRIHWQVGTHLLSAAPDGEELERRENLFTIASHLNLGRDEQPDPATAYLLSNINYHAGNRALDALATEAANEYFRLGRELLPGDCWADDHYERTYRIYQKAAKAELMCGQYESSERLLDSLLEHARYDLDRAECLAEQTTSLSSIGNFIKAIETANRGLAIFDEAIPEDGDEADGRRRELLAGIDARGIDVWETIRRMPFTTERASTIELAFYSELIPDLYMSGLVPQLYLSAVQSTRHCLAGGMDESVIYSFSIMGLMLGEQGDFERAFRYEDLARELSARYPNTFGATRGMNGIVWCNMHSRSHPHEIAEYCLRAIQSGKNCGDLYNAGLSYGPLMWNLQVQGADLPVIDEYARECLQFSNRYHLSFSVGLAEAMQAGWVEPMKREYVPVPMEERLERWERENHIASAGSYFVHRALVHYYLGEHGEAGECLAAVRKYLSGLTDNVLKRQWYVFRVLNALKLYEAGEGAASREELFAEIGPVVEQVEVWAGLGPLLRPYLALVRAELERVTGNLREARGLYLDAIELAHRQGYILLEGHLNECLGDALVRDGQRTGRLYLVEAERLYRQCRAERMLLNLVDRHPAIFEAEVSPSSAETEAHAGTLPNLDIEYLMKSSFAISAEIEQEALLKKIMNVVIESSGGQHGYLLIAEGEDLVIRAESHAADKERVQTPDKRLEEADDICKAIVRYVHRTRQPLILDDAMNEGVFKDNPEVQALQVRSVLCLPVITQSKLTGVLYLENRLSDAVFTSARTDMTALLISQAAISMENATLFAERVRTQDALRETSEYLENLIDYANAPIIVWDTSFRITRFNRAFERLTGRRSGDVLGRSLECLFPEEGMEASLGYIGRTSSGEHWDAVEIPILRTDGSVSTVLWNSANIYNRDGTAVVATIAQGQDITDRKQAELDLHEYAQRLKQSNEDLEYFAYISSHDLQEPLRAISGFAELLERRYRGQLDEKADRYIDFITDGTRQMQQVIQDLLAYSRVQTKVQVFNLIDTDEALDRALANLQPVIREKGAVITRDPLPRVFADGTQITQLFQNLVGNALKFQKPGAMPEIRITSVTEGDRQVFSVTDNGIGIDPRFADRIFKIFQRLHAKGEYNGTGIGLAICRRIVERHGGAIEVESEPGAGSTFSFSIPFHREAPP
ncbi:MAG: AAA family ATPase [Methanospirillum sp.]